MKIIQVLDEISKRNISIVSVVNIISSYKFLSNESKIIVEKNEDKLKKIGILKNLFGNLFFSSEVNKILRNQKPDIVHIHGMWRPIHFFFILHCTYLNIPILVQPHGMLLKEALKSKSFLSYLIKKIFFILNFFYQNLHLLQLQRKKKNQLIHIFQKQIYLL